MDITSSQAAAEQREEAEKGGISPSAPDASQPRRRGDKSVFLRKKKKAQRSNLSVEIINTQRSDSKTTLKGYLISRNR